MLSINSSISDSVALWPHAHTDALTWLVGGVVKLHVEGVPVVDDGFGRAGIVAEAEGLQRGVVAGGFGADGDGRLALPIGDGEVLVPVRGSCKRARGGSGLGGQRGTALRSVTSAAPVRLRGKPARGARRGQSPRWGERSRVPPGWVPPCAPSPRAGTQRMLGAPLRRRWHLKVTEAKPKRLRAQGTAEPRRCFPGRPAGKGVPPCPTLTVVAVVPPVMGHGAPARLRRLSQRRGLGGLSGAFIGSRELHALLRGRRKGWGARAGAEGDFARGRRERGPLITRDPPAAEPRRARPGAKRLAVRAAGGQEAAVSRTASRPHRITRAPGRAAPRGAATLGWGSGGGARRVRSSASGGERGARAACRCCALLGAVGTAPCAGHGRAGPAECGGCGIVPRGCRFWKGLAGIWRRRSKRLAGGAAVAFKKEEDAPGSYLRVCFPDRSQRRRQVERCSRSLTL